MWVVQERNGDHFLFADEETKTRPVSGNTMYYVCTVARPEFRGAYMKKASRHVPVRYVQMNDKER